MMTRRTLISRARLATATVSLVSLAVLPLAAMSAQAKTTPAADPSNTEVSLRSISSAVSRVRSATLSVINDVEQRKIAVGPGDPFFLEPPVKGNPKDAVMWEKEQRADLGKLQPPKKAWIDSDVATLGKWIDVLNQEFGATTFSADKQAAASASWTQMNAVLTDINSHFKQLQGLTAGPTYDNIAIGTAALRIHDDLRKLEKPWRDTLKSVR